MSRILPRYHRTTIEAQDKRKLDKILRDVGGITNTEAAPGKVTLKEELTKPGDPEKLRGIPALSKGVGGTSPGTNPLAAILTKERRRRR